MRPALRQLARVVGVFLGCAVVAAVVAIPVAAEQTIESVRFEDRLGALPVEVGLARNGVSTLDTGILGRLYWEQTGTAGFGASVRATGPPEAGGSLASYASPKFVRTNAQFVDDPDQVARSYGDQLRSQLVGSLLRLELAAGLLGGLLLTLLLRGRPPFAGVGRRWRVVLGAGAVVLGLAASTAVAAVMFGRWDGSREVGDTYAMPGVDGLSFSSPQTLEVARQVEPFIHKNTERIRQRSQVYREDAAASLAAVLPEHAEALRPREGETVVLAEADPQGSIVATQVRAALYPLLTDLLGEGAVSVRTISGDITSNGTVAEGGFVADEAAASGEVPVVAVSGDHDTDTTVEQLREEGVPNPDLDTIEVGGLRVAGANDPAFKALFGGLVVNESGVSEEELGERLRASVDPDEPVVVLLHQPRAAAGYLGVESLDALDALDPYGVHLRTPYDDGIPDVPPGIVEVGHLHDARLPAVIWNTDGEEVTWTVVHQLGTSGGVEENPTFNRFSTPFSVPLKRVSLQLQYVDVATGLETGYAAIDIATDGTATVTDRVDLGLLPEDQ